MTYSPFQSLTGSCSFVSVKLKASCNVFNFSPPFCLLPSLGITNGDWFFGERRQKKMKKSTSEPLLPTYRIRRHRVTIDTWLCSIGQKRDCFARKEGNSSSKCRVSRPPVPSAEGGGTRPTMLSGRPLKLSPVTQGDKCPPTVGMVGELLRAQACDAIQLYSAQFSRQ